MIKEDVELVYWFVNKS